MSFATRRNLRWEHPSHHNTRILFTTLALLASSLTLNTANAHPLVFAHCGASGYRPEHTAAAYELAIQQGANAIEPDLVFSKDGVLVARHENNMRETTDVAEKFPDRKTTKNFDGRDHEGWFAEDFTWDELKTLRAKERLADRDHSFDGQFPILRFVDVIAIAKAAGRPILILPELKHPTYFHSIGFDPETALVTALKAADWDSATAPVIVQSFEPTSLERLRTLSKVPAALLIEDSGAPFDYQSKGEALSYKDLLKPAQMERIRHFAEWIAPNKSLIHSCWFFGLFVDAPTSVIADAHKAGLKVLTWTLRKEVRFVPTCRFGDFEGEIQDLEADGVDAIFADQPDLVLEIMKGSHK